MPRRLRPARLALAFAAAFAVTPAAAQGGNPLEALKPWLEKRLFGAPVPSAPPAAEVSPVDPADAAPDGAPDAAMVPQGEATGADDIPAPDAATAPVKPAAPEPLRFGVLAARGAASVLADVASLAAALSAATGRPVEFIPLPDYSALVDAQVERRIDGGFFSASAFALADTRCTCLEPLVAPRASDGSLAYRGLVVAHTGSGVASAADLAGRTLAVGAADSLGGRRAQLAGLVRDGVDPEAFASVIDTGSADAALRLMLAGGADAAFVWSTMEGDAASGYSRGTLTDLVAAGELAMGDIAIVWRSPPIGHGPFAVARDMPSAEKGQIEAVMTRLDETDPVAYDTLNPYYPGGYAPVEPADYRGVAALATADVDALRLKLAPASTGATTGGQPATR